MSTRYFTQDTLDEAREAHRQGVPLTTIAVKLRCETGHLAGLIGLPQLQAVPANDGPHESDLWASDRLAAQL